MRMCCLLGSVYFQWRRGVMLSLWVGLLGIEEIYGLDDECG